jgi:hypothetical protein
MFVQPVNPYTMEACRVTAGRYHAPRSTPRPLATPVQKAAGARTQVVELVAVAPVVKSTGGQPLGEAGREEHSAENVHCALGEQKRNCPGKLTAVLVLITAESG